MKIIKSILSSVQMLLAIVLSWQAMNKIYDAKADDYYNAIMLLFMSLIMIMRSNSTRMMK